MSDINRIILYEMQSLEDMMQSYQQAIITDPVKLAKLQMKNQNILASLMQQDPGQVANPTNNMDPNATFQDQEQPSTDPNQMG